MPSSNKLASTSLVTRLCVTSHDYDCLQAADFLDDEESYTCLCKIVAVRILGIPGSFQVPSILNADTIQVSLPLLQSLLLPTYITSLTGTILA